MVPPERQHVKYQSSFVEFIDTHPRTGWYLAALMTFNTIINVLELFT